LKKALSWHTLGLGCTHWQCSLLDWCKKKILAGLGVLNTTWGGNLGILYSQSVVSKGMEKTLVWYTPWFKNSTPFSEGCKFRATPCLAQIWSDTDGMNWKARVTHFMKVEHE
jgi:hypothetical protein